MKMQLSEGYAMCFGCGQDNPAGLHLRFHQEGQVAAAEFIPDERHQGWEGIMHGGVVSALLDEAIGYAAYYQELRVVTARMEVRFRRPIPIGRRLLVRGEIISARRKLADARATVSLADGSLGAEATALLYVVTEGQLPDPVPLG